MQLTKLGFACFLMLFTTLSRAQTSNTYTQTNLISDGSVAAQVTDKTLVNPWGVAIGQQTPFWINNAGSGTSVVYDANGNKQFAVQIPSSGGGSATGKPAGIVFNSFNRDFTLSGGSPALFIFGGLDGTISAWNADLINAQRMVDNSAAGAVYTGVALASNTNGNWILAANMGTNSVDVFDRKFAPASLAGKFVDPALPAGFAPFNVHTLNGKVYVLYAQQTPGGGPPTTGPGLGFVSIFDTSGNFLQRAISGGALNAPWGLTLAPAQFGKFGGDLLVGNFGDGTINAYDPSTFAPLGQLQDPSGKAIQNDRLWELTFGQNGTGDPNALYFSAGINDEKGGLFGSIVAATPAGAADFSLAVSSPSVTVLQGGTASMDLTVTPSNGFSGPVTFTASGVPAGVTLQFSPSSLMPAAGAPSTAKLTLSASAPTAVPGPYGSLSGGPRHFAQIATLSSIFPIGCGSLLSLLRLRRRSSLLGLLPMAFLTACFGVLFLAGCGASNNATSTSGSPSPGSSIVTVTATSGALSHTTTFSLVVQ